MTTIAVTGAAGATGWRVIQRLANDPRVSAIRAADRVYIRPTDKIEPFQIDIASADLGPLLDGADSVIHLAEDRDLDRVLAKAHKHGCNHAVVISSAMVYGAQADNPVPLTEMHPIRFEGRLRYAAQKLNLEEQAHKWVANTGGSLAILRPASTVSEQGSAYVTRVLRASTCLRTQDTEPPVQFLHYDDLASAAAHVAIQRESSVFNVAPDGWIGPEIFSDLVSEVDLRWIAPLEPVQRRISRLKRWSSVDRALAPYVSFSWVVANDRILETGWRPAFTNEESFVMSSPVGWWNRGPLRYRQEVALTGVGLVGVGLAAGGLYVARRIFKSRN